MRAHVTWPREFGRPVTGEEVQLALAKAKSLSQDPDFGLRRVWNEIQIVVEPDGVISLLWRGWRVRLNDRGGTPLRDNWMATSAQWHLVQLDDYAVNSDKAKDFFVEVLDLIISCLTNR